MSRRRRQNYFSCLYRIYKQNNESDRYLNIFITEEIDL